MKNTKDAALYGLGFGTAAGVIAHYVVKTKKKVTIGIVIAAAIAGAFVGNNS